MSGFDVAGENAFEDKQQSYYLQQLNRALPVRGGYNYKAPIAQNEGKSSLATMNTALATIDPVMPPDTTQMSGVQSFFSTFDRQAKLEGVDANCRNFKTPHDKMRDPAARTGCGWWYSDDPNTPSVGAHGTRRGPMNPTLQRGGEWIWDLDDAYKREAMKQARAIQACPDLDIHQRVKGNTNLGWCNSTGAALVTDGNGNAAYPNNAGGYCPPKEGVPTISTSSAACPPPDADSLLGAEYADRLKGLNYLCSPNNEGALSPQCMSAMHNIVCSPNGTLGRAFASGGYASSSSEIKDPNEYLQQRGFTISNAILNDGKASFWDAFKSMWGIQQLASSGKNDKMTKAAANLCTGTAFNLCDLADSDVRPFPAKCIREMAISLGYSQNAYLHPENIGQGYWDTHPDLPRWGDVIANLKFWKNLADTPVDPKDPDAKKKSADQANAIGNVYGVAVKFPKQGCNYNGMFMYRYLATSGDTKYFDLYGSDFPFLGRYILKEGFPIKGTTFGEQTPSGQYATEAQRMATVFRPDAGGKYNFYLMTSNFTRISINGKILAWANEQQGIKISEPVDIVAGQTYLLVVDLMNPGGPWSLVVGASINGGASQLISPTQFFMPVNNRAPMLELPFHKMGSESPTGKSNSSCPDTQMIFKNLYRWNAPIGDLNGRRCMLVRGPASGVFNYATYLQGIRLHAIKTITMMIQIDSVTIKGVTPSIVSFYNTPSSNSGLPPHTVNYSTDFPLYGNRTNDFMITTDGSTISPFGRDPSKPMSRTFTDNWAMGARVPVTKSTWMHIAFVWYDDFSGYGIYRDGVLKGTATVPRYNPALIMEHIRIGCDNQSDGCDWTGGIAWFRGFDYRLNEEAIKLDMADNWASID